MTTRFLEEENPDNNNKLTSENIQAWGSCLGTYTTLPSRASQHFDKYTIAYKPLHLSMTYE